MRNIRIRLGKCRVIFFDLEFYVPEAERRGSGFSYNPWSQGSRFLGGSFLIANPERDFRISRSEAGKRIRSLWLWEHGSEKALLQQVYEQLKAAHDKVRAAHQGAVSPILCGIGITSSDVPILFELFKRFGVLTNEEAFRFQNGFRVVDLAQLAIATFNNTDGFLYPKSKSHLLNKYLPGTRFASGTSVWDLYDAGDHAGIQQRVVDEVLATHRCYELLEDDFVHFKALEKSHKRFKAGAGSSSTPVQPALQVPR